MIYFMYHSHIINDMCDLHQSSNLLISQFRSCGSETLDRLHKTFFMHIVV